MLDRTLLVWILWAQSTESMHPKYTALYYCFGTYASSIVIIFRAFYYGPTSKQYAIPESLMVIGQVCVAIYPDDNNWHRTVIMGFRELDFVQVSHHKKSL